MSAALGQAHTHPTTPGFTMDTDKLAKVLALVSSDHDGEAIAAFRMARKMIEADGYDLASIIQAGLIAVQSPSDPSGALTRHAEIFEKIKAAAERRQARHNVRKDDTRYSRSAAMSDIPSGLFEVDLSLYGDSGFPETSEILFVQARLGAGDEALILPTLTARGKIAERIQHALSDKICDIITARIKVRQPFQPGDFPIISHFS